MAQLIQLRHRLKAIETIKKITHAMRLISMSAHSRLRTKEQALTQYVTLSKELFNTARKAAPFWSNPLEKTEKNQSAPLVILIGSQRGLCGTFNSSLLNFFNKKITSSELNNKFNLIVIGKQTSGHIKPNASYIIGKKYDDLSPATISGITLEITNQIKNEHPQKVFVISNQLKGFFMQKASLSQIIPMEPTSTTKGAIQQEYIWEEDPSLLCDQLLYQLISTQIHTLIFQSLLAEQAARFISMDSATRNANNLLESTKLQYNKLRQTKITKELTELTSSM